MDNRVLKAILILIVCTPAMLVVSLVIYEIVRAHQVPSRMTSGTNEPNGTIGPRFGSCERAQPDPRDCASYYSCEGGQARLTRCPAGNHFDPERLSCVGINQSSCGKSSPSPPSSPPPSLSQVEAEETRLTSQGEISLLRARLATLSDSQVELVVPGRAGNPGNTRLVEQILSQQDWDFFFPERDPAYTYTNFLKAVSKFPAVCQPDSPEKCRRVLATMFAHITQETGEHSDISQLPPWRQGSQEPRYLSLCHKEPAKGKKCP